MPFVVRPAEPSDRPALQRLFGQVFGTPPPAGEWEWKYDENPFRGASVAAFDGDDAVGFFGGFATRYRGAAGSLPGVAGVDVMTAPAARRLGLQGVYRELGEAFVRANRALGVPFYFGFPNDRHRIIGERLLGFRTIESVGQWSRPLPFAPPARAARRPFAGLLGRFTRRPPGVVKQQSFGPSHEPLAEELHARAGWRTDRSAETLNWRYSRRPHVGYAIYEARDTRARSKGYVVGRPVGDRLLLVDAQTAGDRVEVFADLVAAVSGEFAAIARSVELRAARTSALALAAAEELGLREIVADTSLEVIPVDPAFDAEAAGRAFDYRFGEHEVY